jgi:hypothetical protein
MKHLALIILSLHLLSSCSVNYHLNKAIKKGYRCDEISDTISITTVDSIPYIVNDSIVWEKIITQKDTIVFYKTSYVPRTRFIVRMDNKRMNDSLKHMRKVYGDSLKAAVKINKQDNKVKIKTQKKKSNLFLYGLLTGIILTLTTRYAISQTLKKYT